VGLYSKKTEALFRSLGRRKDK